MMSLPFHYRHSGLVMASALELPEWEAFACDREEEADVEIVISDEPCPDCPTDGSVAVGEALRFAVEGIGCWQVEGGRRITLHPGLTAAPPELRLFTLGSALGGLGYQRGFAMWHGSAVARADRAILFCGVAGAGKSTMAGAMLSRGASLVADDLSRIEPRDGPALIHPSSARIKLWREAIDRFDWDARILRRDYYREDKFHCSVPDHLAGEAALPLIAIVTLEEGERVSLDRLTGAEALEAAMKHTMYRPEMIEALGKWGEQGVLGAQIAAKCPVYRLTRPKDFESLARACEAAEGLWSD